MDRPRGRLRPLAGGSGLTVAPVRARTGLQVGLLALAPAILAVAGWSRRWVVDDGYIHLRVVDQLLHGNGLVYNAGERVEATTSPLWVLTLAAAKSVFRNASLPWLAVGLGLAASVAGLAMAQLGAAALVRRRGAGGLLLPVGALVVAALPPFWDYATSGLETGLTFAWLGGCFWLVAHRATRGDTSRRAALGGALLIGLGYVIRPDLLLFTVAFLVCLLTCEWQRDGRRRLAIVAAAAAVPLAYQVFRMGYYALLVPNTAIAKEAGTAQWSRGWTYFENLVGPYWLWLPLVGLGGLIAWRLATDATESGRRRQLVVVAAVTVAALLNGLYYVRVGGDFMHARALLPALFALTMPVAVVDVRRPARLRDPALLVGSVAALTAVWAITCGLALRFEDRFVVEFAGGRYATYGTADGGISDQRHLLTVLTGRRDPVTPADYDRFFDLDPYNGAAIRQLADDDEQVLVLGGVGQQSIEYALAPGVDAGAAATIGAAGLFAYEAGRDVYVIDTHGLAEPVGAHLAGLDDRSTGHQKLLSSGWIVGRLADADAAAPASPVAEVEVERAREALSCGQLRDLLDDIGAGLGPRRFLGNLVDSFANTSFRIPRRPGPAVDDLC